MKVLTVGTSNITELLIEGFKKVGIEVFACCGRDQERTRQFSLKNGIAYHTDDYDGALRSDAFDTVYLGLPNSKHYEYALKALMAGKNVIVEKPFVVNIEEAKQLVTYANSHNLFIFDANTTPHSLAYKQLKDDIKMLGQIRMVELDYSKYSSKYGKFLNGETPNIFNPEYATGALMDLGVYNISFAIGLFGLPKYVRYFPTMQRGIDTSGISVLDYGDFKVCAIACKDANRGSLINILGENGNIVSYEDNNELKSYQIKLNTGEVIEREFDYIYKYFYELADFKSIIEYKNIKKNNEYLTQTLMTIKTMDELRKSCGLKFPCEK